MTEFRKVVEAYKAGKIQTYDEIMRALAELRSNFDDDVMRYTDFNNLFVDNQGLYGLYRAVVINVRGEMRDFKNFTLSYLSYKYGDKMVDSTNPFYASLKRKLTLEEKKNLFELYHYFKKLMLSGKEVCSLETFVRRLPKATDDEKYNPLSSLVVKPNKNLDVKVARDFYYVDENGVATSDIDLAKIKANFQQLMVNIGYTYEDEHQNNLIAPGFVPPGYEGYISPKVIEKQKNTASFIKKQHLLKCCFSFINGVLL